MAKPHFHSDLAFGQAGERAFIILAEKNGLILTQTDGRKGDLLDADGNKFELKTDKYDHARTNNIFLEMYSDVAKGKLGGPAQALMNDCKFFAYFFIANSIAYVFDTADLVEQMKVIDLGRPKEIKNVRWTSLGYAVDRSKLKPLYVWRPLK